MFSNSFSLLGDGEAPAASTPSKIADAATKPQDARGGQNQRGRGNNNRGRGQRGATVRRNVAGGQGGAGQIQDSEQPLPEGKTFREDRPRDGRGRGGRGGRGGGFSREARSDRHSRGKGPDSDKRIAQGWGQGGPNEADREFEAETGAVGDAKQEETNAAAEVDPWAAEAPAGEEAAQPERPPRQEEEDNTKTLAEYDTQETQEKLAALVGSLELREVDTSGFDDSAKVQKDTLEYFPGGAKAKRQKGPKDQDKKQALEGGFRLPPISRGPRGGPRGGAPRDERGSGGERNYGGDRGFGGERGRGRGGDRRGAYRGGRGRADGAPLDMSSFPALTAA